jgi:hypothetical protein
MRSLRCESRETSAALREAMGSPHKLKVEGACPKNDASGIRPAFVCRANFFGVMHYEGVEYVVRASLGRNEWALLIYFPDTAPDSSPTVVKFNGSRDEAGAAARRRIDNWIKRQQRR